MINYSSLCSRMSIIKISSALPMSHALFALIPGLRSTWGNVWCWILAFNAKITLHEAAADIFAGRIYVFYVSVTT